MAVPSKNVEELSVLCNTIASTLTLLSRFQSTLILPIIPRSEFKDPPDPLSVLHDSAKLLKAHTTKISLLVINEPFTPSAIRKIVTEVTNTCIPAMMSAVEICTPLAYGKILEAEAKSQVRRCFTEFGGLLQEVNSTAEQRRLSSGGSSTKTKKSQKQNKDSLASTGVVWEACDSLMQLKELGLPGLLVKKAQIYRETLQDAIAELREWGEEVDEDEGFEEGDADSDEGSTIQDMLNADKLPKDRGDLKALLALSLKKLRLTSTLYQALIKRRLKTLDVSWSTAQAPESENPNSVISQTDRVMVLLQSIPDQTDDLASAFYDLDEEEAKVILNTICDKGKETIGMTRLNWSGQEDEFSVWSDNWIAAVDQS